MSPRRRSTSVFRCDRHALLALIDSQRASIAELTQEITTLVPVLRAANSTIKTGNYTRQFLSDVRTLRASLQRARRTLRTAQELSVEAISHLEDMTRGLDRAKKATRRLKSVGEGSGSSSFEEQENLALTNTSWRPTQSLEQVNHFFEGHIGIDSGINIQDVYTPEPKVSNGKNRL